MAAKIEGSGEAKVVQGLFRRGYDLVPALALIKPAVSQTFIVLIAIRLF
jgi:hypothetical protein